LKTKISN